MSWAARWMHSVAPVRPKFSSVSPSGIADARPETRVRITDCPTVGTVSSWPSAAATAENDATPGTIS